MTSRPKAYGNPFHMGHCAAFALLSLFSLMVVSELRGGGLQHGTNSSTEQRQAAALEVLRLLPLHAAMVRALAVGSDCPPQLLVTIVESWAMALVIIAWAGGVRRGEQLAAWVAAMDAGMRLLPVLEELDASWRQLGTGGAFISRPAAQLAGFLLRELWLEGSRRTLAHAMPAGSVAVPHPLEPGQLAPLADQLWQLHSTGCRLLHWAAGATAGDGTVAAQLTVIGWVDALHALHVQMMVCLAAQNDAEQQSGQPSGTKPRCAVQTCGAPCIMLPAVLPPCVLD
jgi:hypothetical protein